MIDRQEIERRIASLTKQRDDLVTEANLVVAKTNGMIAAYEDVLRDMTEGEADDSAQPSHQPPLSDETKTTE